VEKDRDSWRLFDVVNAPGESTNLMDAEPAVFQRMRQQVEDWVADVARDPGLKGRKKGAHQR
jgi:hypothetical protein